MNRLDWFFERDEILCEQCVAWKSPFFKDYNVLPFLKYSMKLSTSIIKGLGIRQILGLTPVVHQDFWYRLGYVPDPEIPEVLL